MIASGPSELPCIAGAPGNAQGAAEVGLLGGMSWESTVGYYKAINQGVKHKLGGLHSAQIAMVSVDFDPIEKLQHQGDWDGTAVILARVAQQIQAAGADFLLICTNTMHKVAPQIQAAIQIPILHIADATAEVLRANNIHTVGLLGTAFTMEQDFYKGRLEQMHGLKVLVPDAADRQIVHNVIYHALCVGKIEAESKQAYLRIIEQLARDGAQGVILGCTEIGMLVQQADTAVDLYDTTAIHAAKAVEQLLYAILISLTHKKAGYSRHEEQPAFYMDRMACLCNHLAASKSKFELHPITRQN